MPFAAVFIFDRAGVSGVFLMIAVMYTLLAVACRFAPRRPSEFRSRKSTS